LMWSHYGGRYRGFCLEFRTKYKPFTQIQMVNYVEAIPAAKILPLVIDRDASEMFFKLYCTKSRAWEHEREWRGFHKKAGTLFTYEAGALKAVFFGPDIDRQSLEIVCLILGGQNPNVEFWLGKRSKEAFKIEFEKTEYTPFIVAKKRGLV
jgi:hypothetical protein